MELEREKAYTGARHDVIALIPPTARSVLDCGCSDGATLRALLKLRPDSEVVGIEFDGKLADKARRDLPKVLLGDLNHFDWEAAFGDQRFDCIIMADVVEHLTDPVMCLTAASRQLSPNGCILVSVPNIRHHSALWTIVVQGEFPRRERGIFDGTHLRWFTSRELEKTLADVGLSTELSQVTLRWGDTGGGKINRFLSRYPARLSRFRWVREFFGYQLLLRVSTGK